MIDQNVNPSNGTEPEYDEFGIPIKRKKVETAKQEYDEFGIPIKKKELSGGGSPAVLPTSAAKSAAMAKVASPEPKKPSSDLRGDATASALNSTIGLGSVAQSYLSSKSKLESDGEATKPVIDDVEAVGQEYSAPPGAERVKTRTEFQARESQARSALADIQSGKTPSYVSAKELDKLVKAGAFEDKNFEQYQKEQKVRYDRAETAALEQYTKEVQPKIQARAEKDLEYSSAFEQAKREIGEFAKVATSQEELDAFSNQKLEQLNVIYKGAQERAVNAMDGEIKAALDEFVKQSLPGTDLIEKTGFKAELDAITNDPNFDVLPFDKKSDLLKSMYVTMGNALAKKGMKDASTLLQLKEQLDANYLDKFYFTQEKAISPFALKQYAEQEIPNLDKKIKELRELYKAQQEGGNMAGGYYTNPDTGERMPTGEAINNFELAKKNLDKIMDLPDDQQSGAFADFMKGFSSVQLAEKTPFLSSLIGIGKSGALLNSGLSASPNEGQNKLLQTEAMLQEYSEQTKDQRSEWYDAGYSTAYSIPFMGEFMLTMGVGRGTAKGLEKIAEKKIKDYAESKARKFVLKPLFETIGTVAQTAANPQQVALNTMERMTPEMQLTLGEDGDRLSALVDKNSGESFDEAFAKGFGQTWAEFFTERAGSAIPFYTKGLAGPVIRKSPEWVKRAFISMYMRKTGTNIGQAYSKLKNVGWDGLVGEFAEEIFIMPLENIITGDYKDVRQGPYSSILNGIIDPKTGDIDVKNLKTIGISVAAMTLPMVGAGLAVTSLPKGKTNVQMTDINGNSYDVKLQTSLLAKILSLEKKGTTELEKWRGEEMPKLGLSMDEMFVANKIVNALQNRSAQKRVGGEIPSAEQELLKELDKVEATAIEESALSAKPVVAETAEAAPVAPTAEVVSAPTVASPTQESQALPLQEGVESQAMGLQQVGGEATQANPALADVESTAKALDEKAKTDEDAVYNLEGNANMYITDLVGKEMNNIISDLPYPDEVKNAVRKHFSITRNGEFRSSLGAERVIKNNDIERTKSFVKSIGAELLKQKFEEGTKEYSNELDKLNENVNQYFQSLLDAEEKGEKPRINNDISKIVNILYDVQYKYEQAEKNIPNNLSEAYHKAKADGSNPELVAAVEQLLASPETETQKKDDTENKPGMGGEVGVRQEPIQAEPKQGGGTEATATSGNVQGDTQAQEEGLGGQVAPKAASPKKQTETRFQKARRAELEKRREKRRVEEEAAAKKNEVLTLKEKYNRLPKKMRTEGAGISLMEKLQKAAKEGGYEVSLIGGGDVALQKDGKVVRRDAVKSEAEDLAARKEREALEKKLKNNVPVSVDEAIAQYIADGGKFDEDQFAEETGFTRENNPTEINKRRGILVKNGPRLSDISQSLAERMKLGPEVYAEVETQIYEELKGAMAKYYNRAEAMDALIDMNTLKGQESESESMEREEYEAIKRGEVPESMGVPGADVGAKTRVEELEAEVEASAAKLKELWKANRDAFLGSGVSSDGMWKKIGDTNADMFKEAINYVYGYAKLTGAKIQEAVKRLNNEFFEGLLNEDEILASPEIQEAYDKGIKEKNLAPVEEVVAEGFETGAGKIRTKTTEKRVVEAGKAAPEVIDELIDKGIDYEQQSQDRSRKAAEKIVRAYKSQFGDNWRVQLEGDLDAGVYSGRKLGAIPAYLYDSLITGAESIDKVRLINKLSESLRDMGQFISAMRDIQLKSPEGLYAFVVEKQRRDIEQSLGGKGEGKAVNPKSKAGRIKEAQKEMDKAKKDAIKEAVEKVTGKKISGKPSLTPEKRKERGKKKVDEALAGLKDWLTNPKMSAKMDLNDAYENQKEFNSLIFKLADGLFDQGVANAAQLVTKMKEALSKLGIDGDSFDGIKDRFLQDFNFEEKLKEQTLQKVGPNYVKGKLKEEGIDVKDVLLQAGEIQASTREQFVQQLTDNLRYDANLSASEASALAEEFYKQYDKIFEEKKNQALKKNLGGDFKAKVKRKKEHEKLTDAIKFGAFDGKKIKVKDEKGNVSEVDSLYLFAEKFGVPDANKPEVQEILKAYTEAIAKLPPNSVQRRMVERDLNMFLSYLKGEHKGFWQNVFGNQYAMILFDYGTWTNVINGNMTMAPFVLGQKVARKAFFETGRIKELGVMGNALWNGMKKSIRSAKGIIINNTMREGSSVASSTIAEIRAKHQKNVIARKYFEFVSYSKKILEALDAFVTVAMADLYYADFVLDRLNAENKKLPKGERMSNAEIRQYAKDLIGLNPTIKERAQAQATEEFKEQYGDDFKMKGKTAVLWNQRVDELQREFGEEGLGADGTPDWVSFASEDLQRLYEQSVEAGGKIGLVGKPAGTIGVISHGIEMVARNILGGEGFIKFVNAGFNSAAFVLKSTPVSIIPVIKHYYTSKRGLGASANADKFYESIDVRREMYGYGGRIEKREELLTWMAFQTMTAGFLAAMFGEQAMAILTSMIGGDDEEEKYTKNLGLDNRKLFFGENLDGKSGKWKEGLFITGRMYGDFGNNWRRTQAFTQATGIEPQTVYMNGKKVLSYKNNPVYTATFGTAAVASDALLFNDKMDEISQGFLYKVSVSQMLMTLESSPMKGVSELFNLFSQRNDAINMTQDTFDKNVEKLIKIISVQTRNTIIPRLLITAEQDIEGAIGNQDRIDLSWYELASRDWPIVNNLFDREIKYDHFGKPLLKKTKTRSALLGVTAVDVADGKAYSPVLFEISSEGDVSSPFSNSVRGGESAKEYALFESKGSKAYLLPDSKVVEIIGDGGDVTRTKMDKKQYYQFATKFSMKFGDYVRENYEELKQLPTKEEYDRLVADRQRVAEYFDQRIRIERQRIIGEALMEMFGDGSQKSFLFSLTGEE